MIYLRFCPAQLFCCRLCLASSLILHFLVALVDLRITSNIGQPRLNRLNMNYSFHICATSLVFLLIGVCPISWRFAIALSSADQLLKRARIVSRSHGSVFPAISSHFASADFYSSFLELMTFMQILVARSLHSRFLLCIVAVFYFWWFLMYRYATNAVHQQLWNTFSFRMVRLAGILPAAFDGCLISVLAAATKVGTFACKFYQRKINEENEKLLITTV
jgi:hypothetical protein